MFLLNVGVYLQVQMLSQSRRPATTWDPKLSYGLLHYLYKLQAAGSE
jgi:hypothetical protein